MRAAARGPVLRARGIGALGSGAAALGAGLMLPSPQLGAAGVFLLTAVLGSLLMLLIPLGGAVETRSLGTSSPRVGERVRVGVRLSGRAAFFARAARWEDGTAHPAGVARLEQTGRGRSRSLACSYEFMPQHRGEHRLGPLRIIRADPFGFAERSVLLGDTAILTVLPRVLPVPLPGLSAAGIAEGQPVGGTAAGHSDLSARPYVPGDSPRRVHWRATAHRNQLMVRQEEPPAAPLIWLLLDTAHAHWALTPGPPPGALPLFERAVSIAAGAVEQVAESGGRARLLGAGGLDCAFGGAGLSAGPQRARRALATVSTRLPGPAFPRSPRGEPASTVIAVVGALDMASTRELLGLARGARRAIVLAPAGLGAGPRDALLAAGWRVVDLLADAEAGAARREVHP